LRTCRYRCQRLRRAIQRAVGPVRHPSGPIAGGRAAPIGRRPEVANRFRLAVEGLRGPDARLIAYSVSETLEVSGEPRPESITLRAGDLEIVATACLERRFTTRFYKPRTFRRPSDGHVSDKPSTGWVHGCNPRTSAASSTSSAFRQGSSLSKLSLRCILAQGVEGMFQTDSSPFHDDSFSVAFSGINEQGAISQFRNGAQTIQRSTLRSASSLSWTPDQLMSPVPTSSRRLRCSRTGIASTSPAHLLFAEVAVLLAQSLLALQVAPVVSGEQAHGPASPVGDRNISVEVATSRSDCRRRRPTVGKSWRRPERPVTRGKWGDEPFALRVNLVTNHWIRGPGARSPLSPGDRRASGGA
jgi:hypothetical protein